MAKEPGTKVKRTRSAKAKRLYLMSETPIVGEPTFCRNGDDAMDAVEQASKEGRTLHFKRVLLPAPVAKAKDAPAS